MDLGKKIDALHKLREKKKLADEAASVAETNYKAAEAELMHLLSASNLTKASGKLATFSVNSAIVPTIKDWDKFYAYIHKNKAYYLLERRAATKACRELFAAKGVELNKDGQITNLKMSAELSTKLGVEPFVKVTPSLTSL